MNGSKSNSDDFLSEYDTRSCDNCVAGFRFKYLHGFLIRFIQVDMYNVVIADRYDLPQPM